MSSAKEKILEKIQKALEKPVPKPFEETNEFATEIFQQSTKELEIEFAENFTQLLGKFSFCTNEKELAEQLQILTETRKWDKIVCHENDVKSVLSANGFTKHYYNDLSNCHISITTCECLIARTGSIFLSAAQTNGRNTSVYAPIHICIAYTNQLVYDIKDGLQLLQKKYGSNIPSLITLATGPSRTADIEKTLVVGVHGPKEVFVFLVDK